MQPLTFIRLVHIIENTEYSVSSNQVETCQDSSYNLAHFFDEIFCKNDWIGVYVTIFGTGAIAIICCIAIWILSLETILSVFKCLRNAIRHAFCAQIPLNN